MLAALGAGESVQTSVGSCRPLAIDLYCGLGGWTEALLAEGWDVIGFDIERHDYGSGGYPGQLVLQDVLSLHGAQFRNADLIVASPPCQFFSRMAMPFKCPWKQEEFERRRNLALSLFWACWRIQHEASEAAGRLIPMIVENVVGTQKWVGRSRFSFGSFHLWGDVPALMPRAFAAVKVPGLNWSSNDPEKSKAFNSTAVSRRRTDPGKGARFTSRDCGVEKGFARKWRDSPNGMPMMSSKSPARKAASAQIAKIPYPLAQHIARVFKP